MTVGMAIGTVVVSLLMPWAVQLIKTQAVVGDTARWLAIGVSAAAGLVTGIMGGAPDNPAAVVACAFAAVGGVQTAYAAFRSVGVTSKWLDALLAVGDPAANGE